MKLIFVLFICGINIVFSQGQTIFAEDEGTTTSVPPLDTEEDDVDDPVTENTVTFLESAVEMLDQDLKSSQCKCGKPGKSAHPILGRVESAGIDVEPLVIGGTPATRDEFPWMVGLLKEKSYNINRIPGKIVCGGSIINNRFILTAAHCIHNEFTYRYQLLFRGYNTSIPGDPTSFKLKVKRFIAHPKWDAKTVANDIGLIELATPLNFTEGSGVIPVCLPSKSDGDFSNQSATVTGWGYTRPKGAMANILQKVTVPVLSHERCTQTRYGTIVTPTMLCAGYQDGGKDACTNDSGGPLTVVQNGVHKLVGIVSWGHGCAQPQLPGVYTRVTKYLDWISSVVSRTSSCSV